MQAEAPLIRCSNVLKQFGTTLANTARWQISSSMLHGFIGAVQSAYGYAKDLNESLNNIRIVTGASKDEMADFAKEANKAAKALSTTTTEYTNASLIFYQQGLSKREVKERTDITIKLANVTRQSAEEVSDQMTAVWNNFYDGSKSLEYYADVLTKLGATTASSTSEIAGGLEKFAAIADTIGLSYEYAASALATITANTRQSEEVVGTALKTIFARIQGLNLGETLDDGTTLNKYSQALAKIGISIFEQNGELKNMDNILDEMGSKWETLTKAQQTALAQTVAGNRQYTQLVALMDEWDAGDADSMMSNLATTGNASGELGEQADIYAESWESARDRVTAAAEELYSKILKDDFFIGFLDGLGHTIEGVGDLIDAFGGLKGVLATVGAYATQIFRNEIIKGMHTMAFNIQ
jgi:TP901 family phage tail tape measure protein